MVKNDLHKRWYIKICRYLFDQRFMRVMAGPLKGYQWTTGSSYEYILGNYEDPFSLNEFCKWLTPITVFYDLGGNVGFYALLANQYITSGKIYSFEPMPLNREIFEKHISLNKKFLPFNNISILPFAISDREKEILFSENKVQSESNTYVTTSPYYTTTEKNIRVKCYSIDELVQQGYDNPDIIKIDVEGAEYDVLKGAVKTLQQFKPRILLATHDCHLPGVKANCLKLLEELGYIFKNTGHYNKQVAGLDDYIAIHCSKL